MWAVPLWGVAACRGLAARARGRQPACEWRGRKRGRPELHGPGAIRARCHMAPPQTGLSVLYKLCVPRAAVLYQTLLAESLSLHSSRPSPPLPYMTAPAKSHPPWQPLAPPLRTRPGGQCDTRKGPLHGCSASVLQTHAAEPRQAWRPPQRA